MGSNIKVTIVGILCLIVFVFLDMLSSKKHINFSSLSTFESIPSSEVAFFSNSSVEIFLSDTNAGSSSDLDIAPNGSTISLDAGPSHGPIHENGTTSHSHDQSLIDSSTLDMKC